MSSRLLGCSLLFVLIAAFTFPMVAPTQQSPDKAPPLPRWEYHVTSLGGACTDDQITTSSNSLGQQGWELVSYERISPAYPKEAQGSMLIAPAATGPSVGTNPPTADSFQGTILMKMAQVAPSGCRMVFKRQSHPQAQP